MRRNPLIVAADLSDPAGAERLARSLAATVAFIKVGLELFVAAGPQSVERVRAHAQVFLDLKLHDIPTTVERVRAHAPVFLDLKLHDIPTTVERAARNAGRLGAALLTGVASGPLHRGG